MSMPPTEEELYIMRLQQGFMRSRQTAAYLRNFYNSLLAKLEQKKQELAEVEQALQRIGRIEWEIPVSGVIPRIVNVPEMYRKRRETLLREIEREQRELQDVAQRLAEAERQAREFERMLQGIWQRRQVRYREL